MEEAEDVYRFQELDSDEERDGVLLDPALQRIPSNKHFNPDELYFNDMDLRAWERRTAAMDALGYADDDDYQEDEGYYEEPAGSITMTSAEYEEFVFQRVLDKIRLARAVGEPDVQLSPEELETYQSRLLRQRAPVTRPPAKARPTGVPLTSVPSTSSSTTPAVNTPISTSSAATTSNAVTTSASTGVPASNATRSKRGQQRTSLFSPWAKKEKPSGRKRAPSNVSDATTQPPGLIVPGPSGQPMYAPINTLPPRVARDATVRPARSPSRPSSRSASMSSQQAHTPPRVTPPREVPGAFPSGSPQVSHGPATPPRQGRPPSSSSRQPPPQDSAEWGQHSPPTRSRSSSIQQGVKLVPFPVTDYQHYTAEPYQYHNSSQPSAPQSSAASSSSQPHYLRRVVSGHADGNYMAMPRRVPVPVQRATAAVQGVPSSYSDPALGRSSALRGEVSDEDLGEGVLVDVVPQADDKSYKLQTVKAVKEGSGGGSGKDSERRRRSGRSRKKH